MILTDAGPLIAVLDRKDEDHEMCVGALSRLRGPMCTTWPAFAEAAHVLGARAGWKGQDALLQLVDREALLIAEIQSSDLKRCAALMSKYRNVPMDLADATLVVLAEKLNQKRIFTLDSDFRIYRFGKRRTFEIVLDL